MSTDNNRTHERLGWILVWVFCGMLGSCSASDEATRMRRQLESIDKHLEHIDKAVNRAFGEKVEAD
jgi:hypothetical protein